MTNCTATYKEEQIDLKTLADAVNALWIVLAGCLCFLLQAGFGLLEVGSVRAKNSQNIMIKNLLDACVGAFAYFAFGYGLAYGDGNAVFGYSKFFLVGETDFVGFFFQFVFASSTATIVSGAVAERCRFRAYLIYSFMLTGFIYPVGTHWVWSPNGFLAAHVSDFAGGGAVHMVGGVAALSGAWILGPRIGRFEKDETTGKWISKPIPPHNQTLAALGAFILWMGFFPFNGASGLNIATPGGVTQTGRIIVVTVMAGASGGITLLCAGKIRLRRWDLGMVINGILSGMVSVCSCCNVIHPAIGIVMGCGGSLAFYAMSIAEEKFAIDDPLGASSLHCGSGAFGLIIGVGLLGDPLLGGEGLFYTGSFTKFLWQLFAGVIFFAWSFGTCSIMFYAMNKAGIFRVAKDSEIRGMDSGGAAYDMSSINDGKKIEMQRTASKNSWTVPAPPNAK
jgi:ammonium transporter, Amt family